MEHHAVTNSMTTKYVMIALKNYIQAYELNQKAAHIEIETYISKEVFLSKDGQEVELEVELPLPNRELHGIKENILEYCLTSCIFSAMALESYIYFYGITSDIERYMKKDLLDKLDLHSKYIVIPRMVVGKDIDIGNNAFCLLKQTIKNRNELIHTKAKRIHNEKQMLAIEENNYFEMAEIGLKTIHQMAQLIENFDKESHAKFMFGIIGEGEYTITELWRKFLKISNS